MTLAAAEIRAFLICDVRGYTQYTVEQGDEAAAQLAAAFAEVVNVAVSQFGGEVLELRGDEALVVFTSARQSVRAAVELQRKAARLPLGIGVGIDAGEAVPVLGGYRGQALNLAARMCSLAAPGEVLASDSLAHLAGRVEDIRFEPRGSAQLKGFTEPVDVVGIEPVSAGTAQAPKAAPPVVERIPIGAYLGSLPGGPLVGRVHEWERLRLLIDETGTGSGRTVLLAGEPGAGKTRLVQEAMLELRDRNYAISTASCLETRQTVPYFPFLDLLPRLVSAYEDSGDRGLDKWPYLASLLAGGGGANSGQAEEERVRRDVAGFIARLSRARPVAMLVDDLHWADSSTLELVHHLARQLRTQSVLIVATYRDVEVRHDHPLERVIRALRRDDLATIVPVRRLDAEGTAALVAASFGEESVSPEFSELIHGQTDGNPFFVQQVLRALVDRGDIYRKGTSWERREVSEIEVPDSIRAAVGERLARLPEISREALSAAAVLGQRFDFQELRELSGLEEGPLEEALEAAVHSGMLRADRAETYAFEHALAQQTLLQEMPARRRRRLHVHAGAVIESRAKVHPARAAEVAYHLVEADEPAKGARWSLIAGRYAEDVVALAEAESHYRQAAMLAEEAGQQGLRIEARKRHGIIIGRQGRNEEAIRILTEVLEAERAAPADDQAVTGAAIGRCLETANRGAETRPLLEPLLELPGLGDRPRAEILLVLARAAFGLGDLEQQADLAAKAREAARRAGDNALEAEALGRLALAAEMGGGDQNADRLFRQAIALAGDNTPLDTLSVLHNNYAYALFEAGDFVGSARRRRISAELAERYANPGMLAFAVVMVGQAEFYRGNLLEARRAIESAESALALVEVGWHHGYVWTQAAELLMAEGNFAVAEERFRRALEAARARGDRQLTGWVSDDLIVLLAEAGRAEEAVEEGRRELEVPSAWAYLTFHGMALAELYSGRYAQAANHAEASIAGATARHNRPGAVGAMVLLGAAYRGLGRRAEARQTLEEAIKAADSMPYPVQVIQARIWLARLFSDEGNAEAAARELAEARRLIAKHGFTYLLRHIEQPELYEGLA